jgi:hypothetical protein
VQVPLGYVVLLRVNPVVIPSKENTFTLAAGLGLDNKSFCLANVKLFFKRLEVSRK